MSKVDRLALLDEFYELLRQMERRCDGTRRLSECNGRLEWPRRGVYFFFESGELREDGLTARVVRVGTHALRDSKSTLWGRLSQHRGRYGGSLPGGGNHRASIFRRHVGFALLATGDYPPEVHLSWARKTVDRASRDLEHGLERAVSDYIGQMPLLWVGVDDPPDARSDRGVIERGAISLLSNVERAWIDPPSTGWLGRSAASDSVRHSGLWNVNHVQEAPHPPFLEILKRWVTD
jgi:hypothetical protein